jgi:hypothetical protein
MRWIADGLIGWKLALVACWIVETWLSCDLLFWGW